jgi:hypothetical protein
MSIYISLGKIPKSAEERKELLEKKIAMEESFLNNELNYIQKKIINFLISEKGYLKDDIETNVCFKINLPDVSFDVIADIILKIGNKRFCFIKCAMNSLESWERHSIAFCRVADQYWIPFAIVTDGENLRILDSTDGRLVAEGLDSILSKKDAEEIVKKMSFDFYPSDKSEKEKRILYAFDAIRCKISDQQE